MEHNNNGIKSENRRITKNRKRTQKIRSKNKKLMINGRIGTSKNPRLGYVCSALVRHGLL